jgi:hypothetical protein
MKARRPGMPFSIRMAERALRHQKLWGARWMKHRRGLREVRMMMEKEEK